MKWRGIDEDYDGHECLHEEFEIDVEGRAHCESCSATWWASDAEIAQQREQQAEYDKWCRQQERKEFWRRITFPIRWPIYRLLQKVWPKKSLTVLTDDEIPF